MAYDSPTDGVMNTKNTTIGVTLITVTTTSMFRYMCRRKLYITNIICYNCGFIGHSNSLCTKAYNPELVNKVKAARDKEKEDNENGDQHLLSSAFDDSEFDNTDHAWFTLFYKGGICTEQDSVDDEVNYKYLTAKTKKGNAAVGKHMILLDNQSIFNVFYGGHLLRNIREVNHSLTIHSDTGSTNTVWIGDLPGFGTVWFHKNSISNILSITKAKKWYQVTYDSNRLNAFEVHKGYGEV